MRYLIRALASVPLLVVALAGHSGAFAQELEAVFDADAAKLRLAQESQERIDKVVDQTRSLVDQFRAVMKEVDGLVVYNTLLDRQIANQVREMAQLNDSIDQVTVIERQIMPLMTRMIDTLEDYVALDVPFLMEERTERVTTLREIMERSDVTVAEKFRRVMEAYSIEMGDYGRTIETYKQTLQIEGGLREVEILRVGRVALLYQTSDGPFTGAWDQAAGDWVELPEYRTQVREGLRMAKKARAPTLLFLPVAAAEAAE